MADCVPGECQTYPSSRHLAAAASYVAHTDYSWLAATWQAASNRTMEDALTSAGRRIPLRSCVPSTRFGHRGYRRRPSVGCVRSVRPEKTSIDGRHGFGPRRRIASPGLRQRRPLRRLYRRWCQRRDDVRSRSYCLMIVGHLLCLLLEAPGRGRVDRDSLLLFCAGACQFIVAFCGWS